MYQSKTHNRRARSNILRWTMNCFVIFDDFSIFDVESIHMILNNQQNWFLVKTWSHTNEQFLCTHVFMHVLSLTVEVVLIQFECTCLIESMSMHAFCKINYVTYISYFDVNFMISEEFSVDVYHVTQFSEITYMNIFNEFHVMQHLQSVELHQFCEERRQMNAGIWIM